MSLTTSKVLLIADSRGRGLENILRSNGIDATVSINPGKGAVISTLASCRLLRRNPPTLIILCGSICDVTYRSATVPYFKIRYDTIEESKKFYIDQVKEAICVLKNLFPEIPVQITPVIGINLHAYNNQREPKDESHLPYDQKTFDPQQKRMDATIATINDEVTCINRANMIPTPWTANVVHARKGSKTFNRYLKLTDGCHLNASTQQEWCKMLILSFKKFE